MTGGTLFPRPTSVFISGNSRALLNWVAYALAAASDPEFVWTDVRLSEESIASDDLLSRDRIPVERLHLVAPSELTPDDATANMAVSTVIRADEPPEDLRRLTEFLRLPIRTQRVLEQASGEGPPRVVVLSNGHRLVAIYSNTAMVTSAVHAIVSSGVAFIMTFADSPPGGRLAFETVIHVDGGDPTAWRLAKIRVEKAPIGGVFTAGSELLLTDVESVATVLHQEFP